jgi:ferredoxin--NADP+ reductase
MRTIFNETVSWVHHWNDHLFSFRTSRDPAFRFQNGEFTMIGLRADDKPLMRAYSMASANYEDHLEFFSIKVPDGPLTSRLQNLKVGDNILINSKPTGTLLIDRLLPARRLYIIATGTGLAPFLSIIRDPHTYEQFDEVILAHGVRRVSALAYKEIITERLPTHEFLGEIIGPKLRYYPTVTREPYPNQGRLTDLIVSGKLFSNLNLPQANPQDDRFMICGSMALNKDMIEILTELGFEESRRGNQAHFVTERAFVTQTNN